MRILLVFLLRILDVIKTCSTLGFRIWGGPCCLLLLLLPLGEVDLALEGQPAALDLQTKKSKARVEGLLGFIRA